MLALVHALNMAQETIDQSCPKAVIHLLQKVIVFSDSPAVVRTVNHHFMYAPDSLKVTKSTKYRLVLKNIIAGVHRLYRRGCEVAFAVSNAEDEGQERARTLARRKGRQTCKSRRRLWRTHNISAEEQERVGGQGTCKLVTRVKECHRYIA